METNSLAQSKYLLERALRTRGFNVYETYLAVSSNAQFRLSFMPGNRRVLISSNVIVFEHERGKGVGRRLLGLREECARECGANLLLATVREDNPIEIHLLETSGWKRLNKRETTGVCLWGKEL